MVNVSKSFITTPLLRLILAASLLAFFLPHQRVAYSAPATIFNVTDTGDGDPGACDSNCTLREAIVAANAAPGTDTINLPIGDYLLSWGGSDEDAALTGDLDITDDLVINGAGMSTTLINAALLNDRVFTIITETVAVTITNLTIQGASTPDTDILGGGGILSFGTLALDHVTVDHNNAVRGAGINNSLGVLTISNSVIQWNGDFDTAEGGGIYSDGALSVSSTTFFQNKAEDGAGVNGTEQAYMLFSGVTFDSNFAEFTGGGLLNDQFSKIVDSTFKGNHAGHGAGIYNKYQVEIENVTMNNNLALFDGGGIYMPGGASSTLKNLTVSANTAVGLGGGIFNNGELSIRNATFFENTAQLGENLYNDDLGATAVRGSILAGSIDENCFNVGGGKITSLGYNLEDKNTCGFTAAGDKRGADPQLLPLANNGGTTFTHNLPEGSPALDAGNPFGCSASDQRGYFRPVDGDKNGTPVCDIGAVERTPSGFVKFDPRAYVTPEGDLDVVLTIKRYGDDSGVSVDCVTQGIPRQDFIFHQETLSWPAGEVDDKTCTIHLLDDGYEEGDEIVRVLLTNMVGGVGAEYPNNLFEITVLASDAGSGLFETPDTYFPMIFH
jgi:CSLREA domain-containing protein